ncbi:hypothetical protein ONZ45_g1170 [Pleurotus djamor]|nr:hypothetical protein ONZ45_g1170 [Pleurotus djamor]
MLPESEALAEIDAQIAHHEAALHRLKTLRNTYSRINKLPDEILSLILVTYKEEVTLRSYGEDFHASSWTNVLVTLLGMMDEMHLPALRTLKIYSGLENVLLINDTLQVDSQVRWSAMPSLRYLELVDILIPSDSAPIPSLAELAVCCNDLTVSWLTTFLRSTPNLEKLLVRGQLGHEPREDGVSKVSLSALKSLHIDASNVAGSQLFGLLDIPKCTQIYGMFQGYSPEVTTDAVLSNFRALCTKLASARPSKVIDRITLTNIENSFHEIILFPVDDLEPFLLLRFPFSILDIYESSQLWKSHFSLSSVTALTIEEHVTFNERSVSPVWLHLFFSFKNLKHLKFTHLKPSTLLVVLSHLEPALSSSLKVDTLEVVSFAEVDWSLVDGNSLHAFF